MVIACVPRIFARFRPAPPPPRASADTPEKLIIGNPIIAKSCSTPRETTMPADNTENLEPADDDEADQPMNRAERRAKGKAAGKPAVAGKIQPTRSNNGPAPRSYANRRSG
jgi:hypothetical protein